MAKDTSTAKPKEKKKRGRFFKETFSELKKVTWPTRKEMINYTLVVLAFMLVMGVVIGLLDGGAAWLVSAIIGT